MNGLHRSRGASQLGTSLLAALACASLCACTTPRGMAPRGFAAEQLPIDLARFAGDWFVIAHIPTGVEVNAYSAVESYALRDDGTIDVAFRFCEGSAMGELQELTMLGWVVDPSTNAEWRVRPVWPLRLAYVIRELDDDYSFTVVTHPSKNYAWVMARSTEPDEVRVAAAIERLRADGFAMERLRRVPHSAENCRATASGAGAA